MNLKHNLETPLMTLKTIFSILDTNGSLNKRMKQNSDESFKRIKEIVEKIESKHCYLEGVYSLVDFTLDELSWGTNQIGRLMYNNGYFSLSITSESRLNMKTTATNCNLFYSGRYEIDWKGSKVKHMVDIALSENCVGKVKFSDFKLEGKTLWLEAIGDLGQTKLKWEKIL